MFCLSLTQFSKGRGDQTWYCMNDHLEGLKVITGIERTYKPGGLILAWSKTVLKKDKTTEEKGQLSCVIFTNNSCSIDCEIELKGKGFEIISDIVSYKQILGQKTALGDWEYILASGAYHCFLLVHSNSQFKVLHCFQNLSDTRITSAIWAQNFILIGTSTSNHLKILKIPPPKPKISENRRKSRFSLLVPRAAAMLKRRKSSIFQPFDILSYAKFKVKKVELPIKQDSQTKLHIAGDIAFEESKAVVMVNKELYDISSLFMKQPILKKNLKNISALQEITLQKRFEFGGRDITTGDFIVYSPGINEIARYKSQDQGFERKKGCIWGYRWSCQSEYMLWNMGNGDLAKISSKNHYKLSVIPKVFKEDDLIYYVVGDKKASKFVAIVVNLQNIESKTEYQQEIIYHEIDNEEEKKRVWLIKEHTKIMEGRCLEVSHLKNAIYIGGVSADNKAILKIVTFDKLMHDICCIELPEFNAVSKIRRIPLLTKGSEKIIVAFEQSLYCLKFANDKFQIISKIEDLHSSAALITSLSVTAKYVLTCADEDSWVNLIEFIA